MSGLGLKLGGNRTWVATIVVLQVANSTDLLASSIARIGLIEFDNPLDSLYFEVKNGCQLPNPTRFIIL